MTIGSKNIFVTHGEKVFKVNEDIVIAIPELDSNHEEADTRIILHTQHANQHFQRILISSPNTDVFINCISFQRIVDANLYFLTGVRNSRRIIDIRDVV